MKAQEFRKLIREEIRKVMSEAPNAWDKKSIEKFLKYLTTQDLKVMSKFKTESTGKVEIMIGGMSSYEAVFSIDTVKPYNLVFVETSGSDFPSDEFAEGLQDDAKRNGAAKTYAFAAKGKKLIVTLK